MKNLKISLKAILLCISLAMIPTTLLFADPIDEDDPENVPIDGGVSLLIGAAAVYGAKKLRDKNKNKQQQEK